MAGKGTNSEIRDGKMSTSSHLDVERQLTWRIECAEGVTESLKVALRSRV